MTLWHGAPGWGPFPQELEVTVPCLKHLQVSWDDRHYFGDQKVLGGKGGNI